MQERDFCTKFRVRLLSPGDAYGRQDCFTADEVLVEFYDRTQDPIKFPQGQFISRYYASTLLKSEAHVKGLCLHGGIPSWNVDAKTMAEIINWISELVGLDGDGDAHEIDPEIDPKAAK